VIKHAKREKTGMIRYVDDVKVWEPKYERPIRWCIVISEHGFYRMFEIPENYEKQHILDMIKEYNASKRTLDLYDLSPKVIKMRDDKIDMEIEEYE